MDEKQLLPIKVVIPRPEDIVPPDEAGGKRKIFDEETLDTHRRFIAEELEGVRAYFADAFQQTPDLPCVATVKLRKDAIAKSHRPLGLLSRAGCPAIGVRDLGELLIGVRSSTLDRLAQLVREDQTDTGKADISVMENIVQHTIDDAVPGGLNALFEQMRFDGTLKLKLFVHKSREANEALLRSFQQLLSSLSVPRPEPVPYSERMRIFRLNGVEHDAVPYIAGFVGTQSVGTFPYYRVLRSTAIPVRELTAADFPPPVPGQEYPVVGIIDSGTDPTNPLLAAWVIARHDDKLVAGDTDFDHGSFVAGLIAHSQRLNKSDPRFHNVSALIVDVAAVPKSGLLREDQLLTIIEDVLPLHPEVRVWALALATDRPCRDTAFSDLGMAFDRLQDEHDKIFVVAAGNYERRPFRGWPSTLVGDADRICGPADSVRSITTGSLAHLDSPNSCVLREQPSPFSRRGPGPAFQPKPELMHYAGNCSPNGDYAQTGVLSINGSGALAEDIGTSFAVPQIAAITAAVADGIAGEPSRPLVKALMVQSAVLRSGRVNAEELRYRGFGIPGELAGVLTCTPWSATLIFEAEIAPARTFEKWPLPMPPCLRNDRGLWGGEIIMTLAYDPPIDGIFGAEYCRRNVDASLGSYDPDRDGKRRHFKRLPAEPRDIGEQYESWLVEHGFKWSPLKVYRKRFRGVAVQDWRLAVSVINRKEDATSEPQHFAIVVTILDPLKKGPVYEQVVAEMIRNKWTTVDLQVRDSVRVRL